MLEVMGPPTAAGRRAGPHASFMLFFRSTVSSLLSIVTETNGGLTLLKKLSKLVSSRRPQP